MALAATEKAKVCTSVRIKYFTVATIRPERRLRRGRIGCWASAAAGGGTVVIVGFDKAFANVIKGIRAEVGGRKTEVT